MDKISRTFISGKSDKPCVFLPFLGEFGIMIFRYIKFVHFYQCPQKIVMCPKEDRIFFPSANEFLNFPSICERHHLYNKMTGKESYGKYKQIADMALGLFPNAYIPFFEDENLASYAKSTFDLNLQNTTKRFDVSLGSRKKSLFEYKNYKHWNSISENLSKNGCRICVVGSKKFGEDISKAIPSWSLGDDSRFPCMFLKMSKIYVGTSAGISHLACFLQIPSLLIKPPNSQEWTWLEGAMMRELKETNDSFVKVINGWDNPDLVVSEVLNYLGSKK